MCYMWCKTLLDSLLNKIMSVTRRHAHTPSHSSYGGHSWTSNLRYGIRAANKIGKAYLAHRKRKHDAIQSHHHTNKRREVQATGIGNNDGATNIVVPIYKGGHLKVKERKVKSVKVTKHFRKMVEKCDEKGSITGSKRDIFYAYPGSAYTLCSQAYDNFQETYTSYSKWSFLPEYFLDAASVLWNGKTPSALGWQFNSVNNMGVGQLPIASGKVASGVKFTIIDSYEKYLYKNQTNRTWTIKLYECGPKKASFLSTSTVGNDNVTHVAGALDALVGPASTWSNVMGDAAVNSNLLASFVPSGNSASVIGTPTPNTLYTYPTMFPQFAKLFQSDCTTIVLEPGMSFEYYLQGPNNMEFSLDGCFNNGNFAGIQKYSRYLMPVYYPDLTSDTTSTVLSAYIGRHPAVFTSSNGLLGYEREMFCKLKMPEETGFVDPAAFLAGTNQVLGYRKHALVHNVWTGGVGTVGVGYYEVPKQSQTQTSFS